jgi:hypothetical protein
MPQLLVRGISVEDTRRISGPLIRELAEICQCGTDNFMLECLNTISLFEGEEVASFPFVEVAWFERGKEIRDRFAAAVTKHVQSLGVADMEVAFITYDEDKYYINGKPCK